MARPTPWTTLTLIAVVLAAGCTDSAPNPAVDAPEPTVLAEAPITTEATVGPRTPSSAEEPVADTPDLPLPAGPHPSFNESAGCGSLQGYRGPLVAEAGQQDDGVVISGPWGDYFGRDIAEVRSHLVLMELPTVGEDADNKVWVHDRVAPALQRVIDELLEHRLMGFAYRIDVTSSFRPSTVPPNRYLSFHAVGSAIDINPIANPYRDDNVLVTDMPEWFVQIWRDAGWCWGGDWQDIKDPMHFSWRGPLHTEGHPLQPPIEPRTDPDSFLRSLTFRTHLGPAEPDAVQVVADIDRDGAPDAVRISPWTESGRLGVEAARARHSYATCWTTGVTSRPSPPGATLLLADRTGGGRPDLWEIAVEDGTAVVTVHAFATGYRTALSPVPVPTEMSPGTVFLLADHDRDGATDLYVLSPGDPLHLDVFGGPGFGALLSVTIPVELSGEWSFALGDHDADGVPDLHAVSPDDPAIVLVASGAGGFTAPPLRLETAIGGHDGDVQAADLDGDGRDDLLFFDGDGSLTVYFGGRTGEATAAELNSWFLVGDDDPFGDGQPWSPGAGCRVAPGTAVSR